MIALTSYGHARYRERARTAGFGDYVVKPVGVATLIRVIAAARR